MYFREIAYTLMDEDIAYFSPSTVYRILKKYDLITPWDQPYRNVLMEIDFTGGQALNDLITRKVTISVSDVMKEDSTEDQRKLAERRR